MVRMICDIDGHPRQSLDAAKEIALIRRTE
jgi:hypothetical protein